MEAASWVGSSQHGNHRDAHHGHRNQRHRRKLSLFLENLEGRQLLSQGIRPLESLPAVAASNMITGPDGDLWVAISPNNSPVFGTVVIDRIAPDGSITSFPFPGAGGLDAHVRTGRQREFHHQRL